MKRYGGQIDESSFAPARDINSVAAENGFTHLDPLSNIIAFCIVQGMNEEDVSVLIDAETAHPVTHTSSVS